MRKVFAGIGAFLMLMAAFTMHGQAAMKTLSATPTVDQDWMAATTGYDYNCGPVTAAEVMAYWAFHGFPNLMSAPPTGQVPDTSAQIVSLFRSMVQYTTYDDSGYTYTPAEPQLAAELKSYLTLKGYTGTVELAGFGKVTFARLKSEIDAGRPVMLLVQAWSHWLVVKGYDDATQQLRVLWGHDTNNNLVFERTVSFSSINAADTDPDRGTNAVYIRVGSSTCTYTISPTSATIGSSGGTGTISVSAPGGCSWSASTGASWAVITSGATGSGNGTVTCSIQANTGSARTVAFSIAGKIFSLTQSGATSGTTTQYTLAITKKGTGSGTVTANPAGLTYAPGTYVTLTATPDSNSVFAGWSGACSGTQTTCSGKMSGNTTITATFNAKTASSYTISASAGSGGWISPSGTVTVASGSGRTFTITPNTGYRIGDVTVDGRSAGPVSSYTFVNVNANHTIRATFTSASALTAQYTLTITKTGTGSGTVTVNPAGPQYSSGTWVTLKAVPDSNSVFAGWSGACSGTQTTCSGSMTRNVSVSANFRSRY